MSKYSERSPEEHAADKARYAARKAAYIAQRDAKRQRRAEVKAALAALTKPTAKE